MKAGPEIIELLQNQRLKLKSKDLDFMAWKKATLLIIESIFGPHSPQANALNNIDYEYSSWTLRDETGNSDPIKSECNAIIEVALEQLKIGMPYKEQSGQDSYNIIWNPFEDELTGANVKKLKTLLIEHKESESELDIFLSDLPNETGKEILKQILNTQEFKSWLVANKK